MALIGRDEVVLSHIAACEIIRKLRIRSHVLDAVERLWIDGVGKVVKVNKRIVFRRVMSSHRKRAIGTGDAFLIRLPRDAGILEKRGQMIRGRLMVHAR